MPIILKIVPIILKQSQIMCDTIKINKDNVVKRKVYMEHIKINLIADMALIEGAELLSAKLNIKLCPDGIPVSAVCKDKLTVSSDGNSYIITYSEKAEFFRGLAICAHSISTGSFEPVDAKKHFDTCGAMIDLSRNMVYTVDTLKDYIEYMALMGLNMLMLYTEDTYEIDKYPMFGFMRGRYTKAELKEIDAYAAKLGIELIPCIQTLSHLSTTLGWGYAANFRNTSNCLCVGQKETYDFIEEMFKTVKECFSSKRIHIGLDEAVDVSFGKTLKERGYVKPFDLMVEHVNNVCELCKKYDLEPMMWSDMFFKNGVLGGDYDRTSVIPEDASERLAKNIEMVYWDYCYENPKVANYFINAHREHLGRKVVFAGGIWTWNRLVPSFVKTFDTARGQLKACKENGVRDVFATVWANTCAGFDFSILPGLQMYAEQMYNDEVSDAQLSHMFEVCTGYRFEDFMLLGLDDFSAKDIEQYGQPGMFCINSSAQIFFNDIMLGLYDKTLSGYDFKSHYKKYLKGLEKLGDMGKFNDIFNQTETLAKILVIKSTIGPEIRDAYLAKDNKKLTRLSAALKELLVLYKSYHAMLKERWLKINKPFGIEGVDTLLGGVESRIETAMLRVNGYLSGTYAKIEELEEERVYYKDQENPLTESNLFKNIISVCAY